MSVSCECCVLSGRGLSDGLITRPEESYLLWCIVCDLETSKMRRPWTTGGLLRQKKKKRKCRKNGSYQQKTGHWYSVISRFDKPLKHRFGVTSFRL